MLVDEHAFGLDQSMSMLVGSPAEQSACVNGLLQMLESSMESNRKVASAGVIPVLLPMLNSSAPNLQPVVAKALRMLAVPLTAGWDTLADNVPQFPMGSGGDLNAEQQKARAFWTKLLLVYHTLCN